MCSCPWLAVRTRLTETPSARQPIYSNEPTHGAGYDSPRIELHFKKTLRVGVAPRTLGEGGSFGPWRLEVGECS